MVAPAGVSVTVWLAEGEMVWLIDWASSLSDATEGMAVEVPACVETEGVEVTPIAARLTPHTGSQYGVDIACYSVVQAGGEGKKVM
jgi:hypothetical protein